MNIFQFLTSNQNGHALLVILVANVIVPLLQQHGIALSPADMQAVMMGGAWIIATYLSHTGTNNAFNAIPPNMMCSTSSLVASPMGPSTQEIMDEIKSMQDMWTKIHPTPTAPTTILSGTEESKVGV